MRKMNLAGRILAAMCAFVVVGCVDKSFDHNDILTEITLGDGKTVLPLGYFSNKSLGELIGDEELEGLVKDENGNYSMSLDGEGGTIEIEGLSSNFEIPYTQNSFKVDYPSFDFDMSGVVIDVEGDVSVDTGVFDAFLNLPGATGGNYFLPPGIALPKIEGEFSEVLDSEDLHLVFDLPEQVQDIHKIIFKDVEGNHHGAPMHLNLAFNDLAGINGGGRLWFDLKIQGGKFNILNSENELIYSGDHYQAEYAIESGTKDVDFAIYVESIINETHPDKNHHLDIPLAMTYDMKFEVNAKSGNFALDNLPHLSLYADFEFGDAEIVVDDAVNLVEYHPTGDAVRTIEIDVPEAVKSINRIELTDDAEFEFFAHGLSWLGDVADAVEVIVKLPDYLVLHAKPNSSYSFNEQTHELKTSIADLDDGVVIGVEALDFGSAGVAPDGNGKINIEFAPDITAHFAKDSDIRVSSLVHEGEVEISVGVAKSLFTVLAVSGCVDYGYSLDKNFEFEGLGDIDLKIGGVGLRPVISVNITNPLTVSALISGDVMPMKGGVAMDDNSVVINDVEVAAATYSAGVITPTRTQLILADESLRDVYSDAKYTFVACDATNLIKGELPDEIAVKLSVNVDSDEVQTLYVDDKFEIEYDFAVDVPLSFDKSLDIVYSDMVDVEAVFDELDAKGAKVDGVAVIAEVRNTIPLSFGAEITLLDADENPTAARLSIPAGSVIEGSKDGKSEVVSQMRLEFEMPNGDILLFGDVKYIDVKLCANGAAETPVPLNESQYIGLDLKVELSGGITIDIADIFNE